MFVLGVVLGPKSGLYSGFPPFLGMLRVEMACWWQVTQCLLLEEGNDT